MINAPVPTDVYTDFSGLAKLKGQAKQNSPQALRESARQFESVFIQMALKSMRQASPHAGSLLDNEQTKTFREFYDQQLAQELGKRSRLGLADMVVQQLGGKPEAGKAALSGKTLTDYRNDSVPSLDITHAASRSPEFREALAKVDGAIAARVQGAASTVEASTAPERFASPEEFVQGLWPAAKKAGEELGVDPKMLLAQAALESAWGKSMPKSADGSSSHNLFGIKADRHWVGTSVAARTLEYEGGAAVQQRAAFRAYDSYEDSFRDYVHFLQRNPRYADALQHSDDPARFMAGLQRAGYATDPSYAKKVLSIYNTHPAFDGLETA